MLVYLLTYFFCFMSMQTLLVVDEKTDISYNIAAEAAGGLVSARDFINLRHWGERDQTFFIAVNKATFPDMPPQKKYVRYGMDCECLKYMSSNFQLKKTN